MLDSFGEYSFHSPAYPGRLSKRGRIFGEMLGSEVVIFPDCGESFRRSLKTNALYAKRVFSSLPVLPDEIIPGLAEGIQSMRQSDPGDPALVASKNRSLEYLDFVLREQPTVRLVVEAGVLGDLPPIISTS